MPISCALVIGHQPSSSGAVNLKTGLSEYAFNKMLVGAIQKELGKGEAPQLVEASLVYREETYSALPQQVNKLAPDFFVSLHCNAFNKEVSGSEILYYHRSAQGQVIATKVLQEIVNCLDLPNRGVKGIDSEDRGGYLLRHTTMPGVIAEPFFIDNDDDLATALPVEPLARAYANAIVSTANWMRTS